MTPIACRVFGALCILGWIGSSIVQAAVFQFEVLAVSEDWIVIRENLPAAPADTAACQYPGLDPSQYVGVEVHFVRLSPEARRSRLVPLGTPDRSFTVHEPHRFGGNCTSGPDAAHRWDEITSHAKNLGIEWPAKFPAALVLGAAVQAKTCALIGGAAVGRPPCQRTFRQLLHGASIQIGVSLAAIPKAPDEGLCQFVGHRFVAVVQVAGHDFGAMGSVAPGGLSEHYDCRAQQFQPLRLYALDDLAVIVGGFAGTNIADRQEHPFLLLFPTQPAA